MLSLPLLPEEMVYQVLQNLEVKELVRFGATCQRFSLLAKDERLPANFLVPKLSQKVIQDNAVLLFNHPEGDFFVNKEGKLSLIHPMNYLAKWYKRIFQLSKAIAAAVEKTFKEIYRLNANSDKSPRGLIYVWFFELRTAHRQCCYPADYLAKKIVNSKQFDDSRIQQAARLVLIQATVYPKSRRLYGHDRRIQLLHPDEIYKRMLGKQTR